MDIWTYWEGVNLNTEFTVYIVRDITENRFLPGFIPLTVICTYGSKTWLLHWLDL